MRHPLDPNIAAQTLQYSTIIVCCTLKSIRVHHHSEESRQLDPLALGCGLPHCSSALYEGGSGWCRGGDYFKCNAHVCGHMHCGVVGG